MAQADSNNEKNEDLKSSWTVPLMIYCPFYPRHSTYVNILHVDNS